MKEALTFWKAAGLILACLGLVFLVGVRPDDLASFGWYEMLAVFGAVMAAGTVIVIRQLTRTESSATIYASQCVYILLGSVPAALYYWSTPTPLDLGLLVIGGVCATIGQLAMTEGFRHLTVTVGGAFQILGPVLISIGSVWFFAEPFSIAQVFGALLIVVGCYGAMALK